MNYEQVLARFALREIANWHQEQFDELEGDEMQKEMREFHRGAVFYIKEILK